MLHASSHEKRDASAAKARKRRAESKRARATFRRILLRQPERIHSKVRSAQSEEEKTNKKPWKRLGAEIENLAKRQRDKSHHQCEIERQCPASSQPFRKPRHRQATENRRERHQHGCARSKLGRLRPGAPRGFRECGHSRWNINRSRPKSADGSQHEERIQNRPAP